ncbi:MAG: S8 family serine peptidase [Planctomycetes bacterium]|nr:S8 family serine peptidase [Planctomycetota bacterium]
MVTRNWLKALRCLLQPGQRQERLLRKVRLARARLNVEQLEDRTVPSAAHDLVSLTALRADPTYAAIDGQLPGGQRIGVAIIDSGVFANHVDLRDRFLVYYDAITNTQSTNVAAAQDPNGHGTHVAGIVLGGFSNTLQDTVGVAPQAGLVAIRGLPSQGDPQLTRDPVLASLNWVLANYAQYNIKAVNMSLGTQYAAGQPIGGNFNSTPPANDYTQVINSLQQVGITVVAASGNSFAVYNALGQSHPAVFSTFSVGNLIPSNLAAYASGQSGDTIVGLDISPTAGTFNVSSQRSTLANQVVAPGSDIVSTYRNGQYETMGGTSQAAPLVAGMVALMQDAAMTFGGRYLTVSEVVTIVRNTADVIVDRPDPQTYRVDTNNIPRLPNGNIDVSRLADLSETGTSFLRVNVQRAVQAVRTLVLQSGGGGGGGGGGNNGDTNNVIARAVELPPLNGQSTFAFDGRIGTDGQVNVGNDDVDVFKLTLQTPGQLDFLTEVIPGGTEFDAYLRVFDASGNEIASNDDAEPGVILYPALTTGALPAGIYYVGLSSFDNGAYSIVNGSGRANGGSSGDYRVTVTTFNADPNGVIQGAVPIDLSSPNFVWPSDSPAAQNGIFVANKVSSLIDSDPNPLYPSDPSRFPERLQIGPTDVDIFKIVAPDTGRLFVDVEALAVYGQDAVDSYVKIFRLEANGSVTLVGENDDDGQSTDSFVALDVEIGRTYFVALTTFGNRDFNPFDPSGRTSTTNETGLMDVYFSFFNGDVNGTAYANVSLNDNPNGVNGIGVFPGNIGADFGNPLLGVNGGFKDVDFLRITVAQAGALQVSVSSPNGSLDPVLGIWQLNEAGDDIVQVMADSGPDATARFEVQAGQTFWISITGQGNGGFNWAAPGSGTGGDTGDYELTTAFLSENQFLVYSNNSVNVNTPTDIAVGQAIDAAIGQDDATVTGAADVDIYTFQPAVTQFVDIRAGSNLAGKADAFLRIFDSDGNEIAFNDNVSNTTTDGFVRLLVQAGQTYYIGVNGSSDDARDYDPLTGAGAAPGSQGTYTLSVQTTPIFANGLLFVQGTDQADDIVLSPIDTRIQVKINGQVVARIPKNKILDVQIFGCSVLRCKSVAPRVFSWSGWSIH